ncbi:MAG: acetylglutamate kinase [Candidatus Hodarchaeota archaeon]
MKIVIKIGGSLFYKDLSNLYKDVAGLIEGSNEVVIVHGGGPQINQVLSDMGKEPNYIISASGMKSRHTDETTRDAAIMALGGLVNKKMVASLSKHGVNAFGISGVDGKILLAKRKEKLISIDPETNKRRVIRNEYSGKIIPDKVNGNLINELLKMGMTPVIGALAVDDNNEILNTDGDRAASSVCKAIGGDLLISVTDVPGVMKDMKTKEIIPKISGSSLDDIIKDVEGGMKKKIFAVKEALSLGISKVIITSGLVEGGLTSAIEGKIGTQIIP